MPYNFQSALRSNELVIDESNYHLHVDATIDGEKKSKGRFPRDYATHPLGCKASAPKLDIVLPPNWREEMISLIADQEAKKTRISDILIEAGIPCKDQNGTSNCWANAPTHCEEIIRCKQGESYVSLSPAFIATTLGMYGGGMGMDAIEVGAEKGIAPCSLFPANANRHKIDDEILKAAAQYKFTKWADIPDKFDHMAWCILKLGMPVAVGYNWWSHEVTACDIVYVNGKFGVRIRNSWGMSYGDGKGFAILMEGKGTPDDAECPLAAMATAA